MGHEVLMKSAKKGCGGTKLVKGSAKTRMWQHTPLIPLLRKQKHVGL